MNVIIRDLGYSDFIITEKLMKIFTQKRSIKTIDEIWFTEHYPIFTCGLSIQHISLSCIKNIPIVASDRGGKITYHGPGQLLVYLLIDLRRKKIKLNLLIKHIETVLIYLLNQYHIKAYADKNCPGIYVKKKKICSFGLKIIKGCSLYGFSININMNLKPFTYIIPCGNKNIKMTQIKDFKKNICIKDIKFLIMKIIIKVFQYKKIIFKKFI